MMNSLVTIAMSFGIRARSALVSMVADDRSDERNLQDEALEDQYVTRGIARRFGFGSKGDDMIDSLVITAVLSPQTKNLKNETTRHHSL
ncbi:hypothetical protein QYF36_001926 [Acer negundo]|nr:hypothetical protein QYF36_001926 [Acer negundo]